MADGEWSNMDTSLSAVLAELSLVRSEAESAACDDATEKVVCASQPDTAAASSSEWSSMNRQLQHHGFAPVALRRAADEQAALAADVETGQWVAPGSP